MMLRQGTSVSPLRGSRVTSRDVVDYLDGLR
jgi:hypothetical protein